MSTESAHRTLHDVGHRRAILLLGALWGAVPVLTFGASMLGPLSPDQGFLLFLALATVSLGALYELDSRTLAAHGEGIRLAWSYALVAPISMVAWVFLAPLLLQLPGLGLLGIVVGPPFSALLYLWQRGRQASVR